MSQGPARAQQGQQRQGRKGGPRVLRACTWDTGETEEATAPVQAPWRLPGQSGSPEDTEQNEVTCALSSAGHWCKQGIGGREEPAQPLGSTIPPSATHVHANSGQKGDAHIHYLWVLLRDGLRVLCTSPSSYNESNHFQNNQKNSC